MADRLRGQEVAVLLIDGGQMLTTITTIKSLDIEDMLETTQEGYLGESTDRFDDYYRGISGKLEMHIENQDIFLLIQRIIARARQRTPGTQINIKASFNFPNGDRVRKILRNCAFGTIPQNAPDRGSFVTVSLDFKCSDADVISV